VGGVSGGFCQGTWEEGGRRGFGGWRRHGSRAGGNESHPKKLPPIRSLPVLPLRRGFAFGRCFGVVIRGEACRGAYPLFCSSRRFKFWRGSGWVEVLWAGWVRRLGIRVGLLLLWRLDRGGAVWGFSGLVVSRTAVERPSVFAPLVVSGGR